MPYRLLNVEDAVRTRNGLKVEPGVRLRALLGRIADHDVPLPGDVLEIRFPDGGEDRAQVAAFGWEGLESGGGSIYLNPDPTDPRFSLVIAGDLSPLAVPRGSEIWLIDHGPARRWDAGRGWRALAQMASLPKKPVDDPATADRPISPLLEPPTGSALNLTLDPTIDPAADPSIDPLFKQRKNWRRFWRR